MIDDFKKSRESLDLLEVRKASKIYIKMIGFWLWLSLTVLGMIAVCIAGIMNGTVVVKDAIVVSQEVYPRLVTALIAPFFFIMAVYANSNKSNAQIWLRNYAGYWAKTLEAEILSRGDALPVYESKAIHKVDGRKFKSLNEYELWLFLTAINNTHLTPRYGIPSFVFDKINEAKSSQDAINVLANNDFEIKFGAFNNEKIIAWRIKNPSRITL